MEEFVVMDLISLSEEKLVLVAEVKKVLMERQGNSVFSQ